MSDTVDGCGAVSCFSAEQVRRYSRQLLTPDIGVRGQLNILNSSVLVVGAGGLGSSLLLYLAGGGIGNLGIVDGDDVDFSNLHRQVIHGEDSVGMNKAESAARAVRRLNSSITCTPYAEFLTPENARRLVSSYDIVVDASDNVGTRYLVNDACVLLGRVLVSGSALRMDGQVTVYHHAGGPCYRCLFPVPPPHDAVTDCSDGGVLGVVPGLVGCFQALEVLKLAASGFKSRAASPATTAATTTTTTTTACSTAAACKDESPPFPPPPPQAGEVLSAPPPPPTADVLSSHLLVIDAARSARLAKVCRLRGRVAACAVCGDRPSITDLDATRYSFPRCRTPVALPADQTTSCTTYAREVVGRAVPHVLLDVRSRLQFDIAHLPAAFNVPLSQLQRDGLPPLFNPAGLPVFVICRRGVDSAAATALLNARAATAAAPHARAPDDGTSPRTTPAPPPPPPTCPPVAVNIAGGLVAWTAAVDPSFPMY